MNQKEGVRPFHGYVMESRADPKSPGGVRWIMKILKAPHCYNGPGRVSIEHRSVPAGICETMRAHFRLVRVGHNGTLVAVDLEAYVEQTDHADHTHHADHTDHAERTER